MILQWLGGFWVINQAGSSQFDSISEMGAQPDTRLVFTGLLLLGVLSSYWFFVSYVEKTYQTGLMFRWSYRIALLSQVLVALIPSDQSNLPQYTVHWIFALVMATGIIGIFHSFSKVEKPPLPADLSSQIIMILPIGALVAVLVSSLFLGSYVAAEIFGILVINYWMARVSLRKANP